MKRNMITAVVDSAIQEKYSLSASEVQFADGIPTIDDGLAFTISQLSSLESKIYETKYQNIRFQEFVPVDSSDPEWVDNITYISYDAVTMGKFIGANGKDLPESDINASKSTIPVFYGGIAMRWSLDELRKSQAMRMPIDAIKGQKNMRGYLEHKQQVAYFGDAERNVTGLFNGSNVAETVATGFDPATATGDEWVDMLNKQIETIYINSANVHVPNMQLIPQSFWGYLLKPMNSVTTMTILQYYLENNYSRSLGVNLTVTPVFQLNGIGVNNTGRIMTYELNAENLVMKDPMPYRTIAPQPEGLTIKVPAEYKFGAIEFRYPGSALYTDTPA
ncbi:protein of unknown function DUF2184 [Vibrio phage 120E34-1]|nr:protein of unknown function DUF2184 [Vibrio phage 120E34-1]